MGAALSAHHIYFGNSRKTDGKNDKMRGAYMGPEYSELEAGIMAKKYNAVFEKVEYNKLYDKIASILASGFVVGWQYRLSQAADQAYKGFLG